MFKNVAAKFMVFAFDSTTNLPKTGDGANITAYVSKDYGSVTVLADTSATEMDSTNAKGYYLFDAAQGETNGDCLMVSAKSATANIVVVGAPAVIYTRPTTGWLAPTTAARTLTVDASGRALADLDTIKTNPVVNGGTITFPTNATVASTTNITAGTITTVSAVTGLTASDVGAIKTKTDSLTFTVAGLADSNVVDWKGATAPAMTGDAFARLGAPAGASVSADVAAVKSDTGGLVTSVAALPTAVANADALLGRNIAGGSSAGRTVKQALRFLRNKWTIAAGTLTVYQEDDSTSDWTATVSTDATAIPIVGNDPA